MTRVFNFSAGPAALPEPVLRQAAEEMLDWHGSGMSVMEMSHRGPEFMGIHAQAQTLLRELLQIPANYKILFMQGGGIGQDAVVPLNLMGPNGMADYIDTGVWSRRAIEEATKYGRVNVAASSEAGGDVAVPPRDTWRLTPGASYVHICNNETIGGLQYHFTPDVGDVPLVSDMSSEILSRPVDVSRYGLIYAGAQKNIGPAGLTIVIIRDDLLDRALPITPTVFHYKTMVEHDSMVNTPPTYAIYMAGLVFQWIQAQGGVAAMAERNRAKAELLYSAIDTSSFYRCPIEPTGRSLMNVPFRLIDPQLDAEFLKGAQARGLVQLKGHRIVGGMRASIYNAMPLEGVQALVDYMRAFERQFG